MAAGWTVDERSRAMERSGTASQDRPWSRVAEIGRTDSELCAGPGAATLAYAHTDQTISDRFGTILLCAIINAQWAGLMAFLVFSSMLPPLPVHRTIW